MNAEDIASHQNSTVFDTWYSSMTEKTISGVHVHVSPGSAETLVRRGGINHHLIAYSLSNISAKNYQNQLMCVEVIVCNITVVFETQRIATEGRPTRYHVNLKCFEARGILATYFDGVVYIHYAAPLYSARSSAIYLLPFGKNVVGFRLLCATPSNEAEHIICGG